MKACPHEAVVVSMHGAVRVWILPDSYTYMYIAHNYALGAFIKNCIWDERHWFLEKKVFIVVAWMGLVSWIYLPLECESAFPTIIIDMRDTSIHHSHCPLTPIHHQAVILL